MPKCWNTKQIAHVDCEGGGQVWVDGSTMYVSHMRPPHGTSMFDVSDPSAPKLLASLQVPMGWHSHKVRVQNGLMLVNYEKFREGADDFGGGLGIYDIEDPSRPRLITHWKTGTRGGGVHRYDFDGRYAYISPTAPGFVGNIVKILDLQNPVKPAEVGRWWIPGQNVDGGEDYPWDNYVPPRCHHPLRMGNRLYVSYWHHGLFILDIDELSHPKLVSQFNTGPVFPHPTHTALPIAQTLMGRRVLVVADEDVAKLHPAAPAFTWLFDITYEAQPIPIATFQVEGVDPDGTPRPPMSGCHQPAEKFRGTVLPFAWFARGLRLVDISNPFLPHEVGYFEPDVPSGYSQVSSNDVTTDARGLIYLLDRQRGLDIIQSNVYEG